MGTIGGGNGMQGKRKWQMIQQQHGRLVCVTSYQGLCGKISSPVKKKKKKLQQLIKVHSTERGFVSKDKHFLSH